MSTVIQLHSSAHSTAHSTGILLAFYWHSTPHTSAHSTAILRLSKMHSMCSRMSSNMAIWVASCSMCIELVDEEHDGKHDK